MDLKKYKLNKKTKVLIVAAGEGKRANLEYPKTLYKINNIPILIRILKKISYIDSCPTIIVSRNGKDAISKCIHKYNFKAELIIQNKPKGMGNAILRYGKSKFYRKYKNILLIWGDLPFIYKNTLKQLVNSYFLKKSFLTIVTGINNNPYTLILRDSNLNICKILESRNKNINAHTGERDIGIFLFNIKLLYYLNKFRHYDFIDNKKEHNFLYIINILYKKNLKISSSKISNKKEFISFNSLQDLK